MTVRLKWSPVHSVAAGSSSARRGKVMFCAEHGCPHYSGRLFSLLEGIV